MKEAWRNNKLLLMGRAARLSECMRLPKFLFTSMDEKRSTGRPF